MLIINGVLTIDPARRADLIAAAIIMQQASQAEDGWIDQAALDAHFAQPHMVTFQAAIKGAVKGMQAAKYEVASEGPVR